MLTSIVGHLRANVVAYIALAVALGGGGGYAIAATSNAGTITVCANKKTRTLYNDARAGRCRSGQTKLSWNSVGPRGLTGATGATGAQGAQGAQGPPGATGAIASAWGIVSNNGIADPDQGLTASREAAGTYLIRITAPACLQNNAAAINVPTVTVYDANPPSGQSAGAFPTAWVGDTFQNQQFTVFTGVVVGGTFTATDHSFSVQDVC